MVFSGAREELDTRLTINENPIEKKYYMIHLGVWISHDLTGDKHISDIFKSDIS